MKLLIAIPSLDFMHTEFVKSLLALTARLSRDGIEHEVRIESGTLVYIARDKLAQYAVGGEFTHVLWLDSDMVFTEDLLDDLLFAGKDFVTGIAATRRKPFITCVFKSLNPCQRFMPDEIPKDTFEIAGCGFACVLTSIDIIKAVKRANGTSFTPTQLHGEDLAFCKRARDLGFKIYAEPGVRVGHIGHIAIYPEDFYRWKDEVVNIDNFRL